MEREQIERLRERERGRERNGEREGKGGRGRGREWKNNRDIAETWEKVGPQKETGCEGDEDAVLDVWSQEDRYDQFKYIKICYVH